MDFVSFYNENVSKRYDRDNFDSFVRKRKLRLDAPAIHVSGTAGKGCTCRLFEGIYLNSGYKVGAFYSSYFASPCECIHFNGEEISQHDFDRYVADLEKDVKKFDLSPFEVLVAVAYRYFNDCGADIAVIECGIGGSIDATNLDDMDTRLSVITNVGLDHTYYLGTTTSQIASHCAGIIKERSEVLCGPMDEVSAETIKEIAADLKTAYSTPDAFHFQHLVDTLYHFDYGEYHDLTVNTFAEYELQNAILALQGVKILAHDFPITEEGVRKGLMIPMLPGHCERFGNITLDCAENVVATNALVRCCRSVSKGKPLHVIFATLQGKNIAVDLPLLGNNSATISLTTFGYPLAKTEEDYFLYSADHPFFPSFEDALNDIKEKYPDEPILVTGSYQFVAYVRSLLS